MKIIIISGSTNDSSIVIEGIEYLINDIKKDACPRLSEILSFSFLFLFIFFFFNLHPYFFIFIFIFILSLFYGMICFFSIAFLHLFIRIIAFSHSYSFTSSFIIFNTILK